MPDAREMAESVARWMGWRHGPVLHGDRTLWISPKGHRKYLDIPPYADSLDAMHEVEDEIERRGLWFKYTLALFNVLGNPEHEDSNFRYFQLIRAAAAQRLEAAYRVVKEASHA